MTPPKECRYDGCTTTARGLGYCPGHYRQLRLGQPLRPTRTFQSNVGKICAGPDCDRPAAVQGLCGTHKSQLDRTGAMAPIGAIPRGPKSKYAGVSCKFEGCDKKAESLGWCTGHYAQTVRGVEMAPLGKTRGSKAGTADCEFDGCEKRATNRGLCGAHSQQRRRGVDLHPLGWRPPKLTAVCSVSDCARVATRKGLCDLHYRRLMRTGGTDRLKAVRAVDGRRVDPIHGYAAIKRPGHPEAKDNGWGAEHRIVMSDLLGRPLYPDENVHHRNGIRDDNRPENLELWSSSQPPGQRVAEKLAWAREMVARYEAAPEVAVALDDV